MGRRGGRLEGSKQWRQALVGQSRALLIVSVLIESHNETSGAGIAARHPAATGSPYMEMRLILDLLLNAAGIFYRKTKSKFKRRMTAAVKLRHPELLHVTQTGNSHLSVHSVLIYMS